MKRKNILLAVFALGVMLSCKKLENLDREIVGLGGESWVKTDLDDYIYTTFTKPFNIDVKYRWDGTEVDVTKTLVPPKTEKVKPLLEVVRGAWIDPYTAEAGAVFIQKNSPKQYVLVGSLQYNSSGTYTLGEAEGGNKVTLYNVNNFDKTDRAVTQRILKTIHHEFTHILHQTVMYPKEFPQITPAGYTADWNSSAYAAFLNSGFITAYAQAAPNEDFAEMTAIMLTQGRSGYEAILKTNTLAAGTALIRKKEEIVVSYFKQTWGIDFTTLQTRVQKAINDIAPASLFPYLGYTLNTVTNKEEPKTFTTVTINPDNTAGLSTEFLTAFEAARKSLKSLNTVDSNVLDNMSINFTGLTSMTLKLNYRAAKGTKAGTAATATFTHSVVLSETNKTATFTATTKDANATTIAAAVAPLTSYFTQGAFLLNYYYTPDMKNEYGGFTKASNANSFTYGLLSF